MYLILSNININSYNCRLYLNGTEIQVLHWNCLILIFFKCNVENLKSANTCSFKLEDAFILFLFKMLVKYVEYLYFLEIVIYLFSPFIPPITFSRVYSSSPNCKAKGGILPGECWWNLSASIKWTGAFSVKHLWKWKLIRKLKKLIKKLKNSWWNLSKNEIQHPLTIRHGRVVKNSRNS